MIETEKDEIVMKLLHYFMTEKNYSPVQVHGVDNEIWLENMSEDYKIVRIISRYIHNNEQFEFDNYRAKQISKKIKKKTFSIEMGILNIYIDLGDNVTLSNDKGICNIKINCEDEFKNLDVLDGSFKDIRKKLKFTEEGVDLFVKITNDINKRNLVENKHLDEIFKKKVPFITYGLIIINVLIFLICNLFGIQDDVLNMFSLNGYGIRNGQVYRFITHMFLHRNLIHLFLNMMTLSILGTILETYMGKVKYSIIYFISGFIGGLLSITLLNNSSIGASGAIFGIIGGLLYFGYHYRLLLDGLIKNQIIPILVLNILCSMIFLNINIYSHIGGLIGGILVSSIVGVRYKSTKSEQINGFIISSILIIFMLYISLYLKG